MSYSETFLNKNKISTPEISKEELEKFNSDSLELSKYYLDYQNYSLLHNPFRKFPYFTASNIDGALFKKIKREDLFSGSDRWSKDNRIPYSSQFGKELYSADKSDFDKGHMTKREDVQWGTDIESAKKAAESTFYYTNATPQLDRLNRGVWRKIEDYILHHEAVKSNLKISLFTGPALRNDDPEFVTIINNEQVKLPYLFWKVVYYLKEDDLFRTGFITSQKKLLEKRRITKPISRGLSTTREHFTKFKDAETYQVKVSFIEKLCELQFAEATETFQDDTPEKLILSGIEVRTNKGLNSTINLKL